MFHNNGIEVLQKNIELIENGNIQDVIIYAKQYDIFQPNGTKFYKMMCDKIKARLDREGLDYETVRPE
jgi:hypothetical protein